MKVLDKHILRSLFLPIMFCAYTLILLFLIADLFDHLSDILSNRTPLMVILRYYSLLIPFAYSQTIAWATFLGTIYIFAHFTKHNELIAMKASGLDILKIAKPILFLGFFLSIVTFIINDRIVPPTYRLAMDLKENYIEEENSIKTPQRIKNISLLNGDKQYFIRSMDTTNGNIKDIRIHYLDAHNKIIKRIVAQSAEWQNNSWLFKKVSFYELGPDKKIIGEPNYESSYVFNDITITPIDIIKASRTTMIQSIKELKEVARKLKRSGLSNRNEIVDMHDRIAAPWMNLVIVILVFPFLAKSKVRKGMVLSIIVCLLLVFSYHVVYALSLAIGKGGTLPPFWSAWAAHIVYAGGGFLLMKRANY